MRWPGIEPGPNRWQRSIVPFNYQRYYYFQITQSGTCWDRTSDLSVNSRVRCHCAKEPSTFLFCVIVIYRYIRSSPLVSKRSTFPTEMCHEMIKNDDNIFSSYGHLTPISVVNTPQIIMIGTSWDYYISNKKSKILYRLLSSVGRAHPSHGWSREFDPLSDHSLFWLWLTYSIYSYYNQK